MEAQSSYNICITNCAFSDGGRMWLDGPTGNVSIINCIFQNNNANDGGGGAVHLLDSKGDVSITNCTFKKNSCAFV